MDDVDLKWNLVPHLTRMPLTNLQYVQPSSILKGKKNYPSSRPRKPPHKKEGRNPQNLLPASRANPASFSSALC